MTRTRIRRNANAKRITVAAVRNLIQRAEQVSDSGYDLLRRELRKIDERSQFSPGALSLFQDLLAKYGISTSRPIGLPRDDQPFWLRSGNPLAGFRTGPKLPEIADVVVIGAGLAGASTAYHLADTVREKKWRAVVLDQGDPAGEASGRNGGNFELIPENVLGY
jgi:FAD dependent oxidoreductase